MTKLLEGCFEEELARPSAGWCRAKLIELWGPQSPWVDFERELTPPRKSPCVHQWGDYERRRAFHDVRKLTNELLIYRYEEQAPESVKTHGVISEFLPQLHKDRTDALEKISYFAEKSGQQKYAEQHGSSSAPRHVARLSSSPHADCLDDIARAPSSCGLANDTTSSIPDSKIQSSTFTDAQPQVATASDTQLPSPNGSTADALGDCRHGSKNQRRSADSTSVVQPKPRDRGGTVTRIDSTPDSLMSSSLSKELKLDTNGARIAQRTTRDADATSTLPNCKLQITTLLSDSPKS